MRRRTLLTATGSGLIALAGCLGGGVPAGTDTEPPESTTNSPSEWTRSTNCGGMHDSVIKVEWVRSTVDDGVDPMAFSELSPGERSILRTVVHEGGYGTCDPSDAFVRFIGRVSDHVENQEEMLAYLEYEGRYHALYVEKEDMVFSSG